ncbi:glucose-1-phosphate cytidylyltransferase [Paenibacillus oryzisoli]|uniref:Glucose-1-phosphate cytidylyltransferase n=1 Tax=Paenibacillus oryzisoli TaxID=1850517 RepID=A0A198AI82_9BACL|nr:glucose-1-phosphate cytidylyltransferase [Paenibacillus oryzisoli]OAS20741.1 glucose-1-phosphate cytidylyltransferase [Paenibacillus oryzisoli]
MPVVLLCGGKGTRIKEMTETIPKPLVEIGGKPILWHIMKIYSSYGFVNFNLCLGYKGQKIKEYFLNYDLLNSDITLDLGNKNNLNIHNLHNEKDWKVTLANTGEDNMTGSRIKQIEKYIKGDVFMLTYGDGVCNVDINRLLDFHYSHGKIGTVTGVRPPSRFGELLLDGEKVESFSEKPQTSEGRINGGFFIFNREIFNYVSEDEDCIFEREPLERLSEDNELMMYRHDGFWQCMDTLRDMQYLEKLWQEKNTPWNVWDK